MSMEQFFQQPMKSSESNKENIAEWKSQSSREAGTESNSSNGFDCNICFDLVQDPVVTICGHLYCWPCIYKWMKSKSNQQLDCPVCKAQVSQKTLIPLYGRGPSRSNCPINLDHVPQRPSGPGAIRGVRGLVATDPTSPHHLSYPPHPQPGFGFAGTTTYNLMIDMLGEMIYARNFGNPQTTLVTYPNTYSDASMSSVRLRRQVMQADRSLSRVSLFLCCCAILCLLLF